MKKSTFPSKNNSSKENRNKAFPTRLRECRAKSEKTQKQVADEIGVTKSTVSLWENGDTLPDAKDIVALAEIYNVSCDFLLCQTNSSNTKEHIAVDELGLSETIVNALKQTLHNPISFADVINSLNISGSLETLDKFFQCLVDGKNYDTFEIGEKMKKQPGFEHIDLLLLPACKCAQIYLEMVMDNWEDDIYFNLEEKATEVFYRREIKSCPEN